MRFFLYIGYHITMRFW